MALALLFALILSGPVEALHRIRVSRSLSAALILVLVRLSRRDCGVDVVAGAGLVCEGSADHDHHQTKGQSDSKFHEPRRSITQERGNIGAQGHAAPAPPVAAAPASAPGLLLDAGGSAIAALLTFLMVTLFLLTAARR